MFIPEAVQALTMGNLNGRAQSPTMAAVILKCAFVPTVSGGIHPTQKPVELCEYLIRTYTRPGELVADICAGSGTTAIAAINTERRFVCFETAPAFYAAASERIRAAQAVKVLARKECNYPAVFYHLRRSPLALLG